MKDRLNLIYCVASSLVDALSAEDHEEYTTTLLEYVVIPLRDCGRSWGADKRWHYLSR